MADRRGCVLFSLSAKRGDSLPGGNALSPLLNPQGRRRGMFDLEIRFT